jgi:hypothetical protein
MNKNLMIYPARTPEFFGIHVKNPGIFTPKIIMEQKNTYTGHSFHSEYKYPEIKISLILKEQPQFSPIELNCLLDTGSNSTVIKANKLSEEILKNYNIEEVDAAEVSQKTKIKRIFSKLGNDTFCFNFSLPSNDPTCKITLDSCHLDIVKDIESGHDMLIGCNLLRNFIFTCDWSKEEYTLELFNK